MAYVDEALKLDARALMAVAMQTGRQGTYEVRLSYPTGYTVCGDLREDPDRAVSAYITVKWPTRAGDPASGDVLVGWGDGHSHWDAGTSRRVVVAVHLSQNGATGSGGLFGPGR